MQFFIGSMAFATYAVHIQKPENRLDLAFILLLTTVAFKFTVNSSLPRISYLTTMVSEIDMVSTYSADTSLKELYATNSDKCWVTYRGQVHRFWSGK